MPGLDGKGPEGEGPLTGRGRGRCNKQNKKRKDMNQESSDSGKGLQRRGFRRGKNGNEENTGRRRRGN